MTNIPTNHCQMPELELHNEDCITGMRRLNSASVDLVVTSPPYNLGIQYSSYDDDLPRQNYFEWSHAWAAEVQRILKPDGALFLNLGAAPTDPMLPHELVIRLRSLFVLQNTIHWIKAITIETRDGREISAGHFKPINSQRYLNDCHEYLFHLTKSGDAKIDRLAVGVEYTDKSNIARWTHTGGRDRRCRGSTWFIPYETIRDRESQRPHPATFPVRLAAQCIRLHGVRDGMVMLDPFVGIGNSAIAARECGVSNFIGFDIDAEYLAEARARLDDAPLFTS